MPEFDVVDEAIIDAECGIVAKAIMDEIIGKTHWWFPHHQSKPRGGIPPDQVGGLTDITIRRGITIKFTTKTLEINESLLRVQFVEGAYRGEGLWTFERVDGKTRLRYRWRVRPTGWLRWLLLLAPSSEKSGGSHHEVMKAGFEGLNRYLKETRGGAA